MAATPITDQQFLAAWVNSGYDAKAAYLSLRPKVTPDSAAEMGKRKLASCKASGVYQSLLDKAYTNVETLLDSNDENIKLKMTTDLLNRANGKAKENIDLTSKGEKILGINYIVPNGDNSKAGA